MSWDGDRRRARHGDVRRVGSSPRSIIDRLKCNAGHCEEGSRRTHKDPVVRNGGKRGHVSARSLGA